MTFTNSQARAARQLMDDMLPINGVSLGLLWIGVRQISMPALGWLRLAADLETMLIPTTRAYHAAYNVKAQQMDARPQRFFQAVYYLRQKSLQRAAWRYASRNY